MNKNIKLKQIFLKIITIIKLYEKENNAIKY